MSKRIYAMSNKQTLKNFQKLSVEKVETYKILVEKIEANLCGVKQRRTLSLLVRESQNIPDFGRESRNILTFVRESQDMPMVGRENRVINNRAPRIGYAIQVTDFDNYNVTIKQTNEMCGICAFRDNAYVS